MNKYGDGGHSAVLRTLPFGSLNKRVFIIITKGKDGNYSVKGHETPGDGAYYAPSIRKLFPQEYHDKIFSRNNVYDLEPIVEKKAKDYFEMFKE